MFCSILGPEFCKGKLATSFMFPENTSPTIKTTLCGHPKPTAEWSFDNGSFTSLHGMSAERYAYDYPIKLPTLRQIHCGKKLTFKAKGYGNNEVIRAMSIFVTCE